MDASGVGDVIDGLEEGDAGGGDARQTFVLFDLGDEVYALRVEQVHRVVRPAEPVRLPGAPPGVLGVINLRGTIVVVVDPRVRLGLPPATDHLDGRVLVTDVGASPSGLLVDGVREVIAIEAGSVQPAPAGPADAAGGVAGVVIIGERGIVLLDARQLVPS